MTAGTLQPKPTIIGTNDFPGNPSLRMALSTTNAARAMYPETSSKDKKKNIAAITGMKNMGLFLAGLILIVFAGMFHVYRYAMAQSQVAPPPPGIKRNISSKAISGTATKELPTKDPGGGSENNIQEKEAFIKELEKKDVDVPEPQAPEIQSKNAEVTSEKDPNIGVSDLKKP